MNTDQWRAAVIWVTGAAVIPLMPVLYVCFEGAGWDGATKQGELLLLSLGIIGASSALELMLSSNRLSVDVFRVCQLVLLLIVVFAYTGQVDVASSELRVELYGSESRFALLVLLLSGVMAIGTVVRKERWPEPGPSTAPEPI